MLGLRLELSSELKERSKVYKNIVATCCIIMPMKCRKGSNRQTITLYFPLEHLYQKIIDLRYDKN